MMGSRGLLSYLTWGLDYLSSTQVAPTIHACGGGGGSGGVHSRRLSGSIVSIG